VTADSVLLAADVAFAVVFGVFVVAVVVLAVITLTWAVRRDRAGRRAWLARRAGDPASDPDDPGGVPRASSNGHKPVRRARPERPPQ